MGIDGIIKIPQSEAAQLVNYTMPLASEPGMYMVEIDVFHQLHCLVDTTLPPPRPGSLQHVE